MFDWIIEADIYRLRKAASEVSDPIEQRTLRTLAEQKERIPFARRDDVSGVGHRELSDV